MTHNCLWQFSIAPMKPWTTIRKRRTWKHKLQLSDNKFTHAYEDQRIWRLTMKWKVATWLLPQTLHLCPGFFFDKMICITEGAHHLFYWSFWWYLNHTFLVSALSNGTAIAIAHGWLNQYLHMNYELCTLSHFVNMMSILCTCSFLLWNLYTNRSRQAKSFFG